MNNKDFSELVRKGSEPTSKEIARKAVEEEFKRKKKRKRGYSSSSDEEDRKPRKKESTKRGGKDEEDEEPMVNEDYRDRAKERREGKENEGEEIEDILLPSSLSRKGLNLDLARKARHDLEKEGKSIDAEESNHRNLSRLPTTLEDAHKLLLDFKNDQYATSTTWDNHMYLKDYLFQLTAKITEGKDQLLSTVAGKSLQRSRFVFALDGNPCNYLRAWEQPRETSVPIANGDDPPMAFSMIQELHEFFKRKERKQWKPPTAKKTVEAPSNVAIDDDEDIFSGVGEYVPPTK